MTTSAAIEVPEPELLPLLDKSADVVRGGVVDYKGRPADRRISGGWTAAVFLIGVELMERFAHAGISYNLISYLTGPMGLSRATAAENVNTWNGVAKILPMFGAFIADSYLGRYHTILFSSLLYVLGLSSMTLSAVLLSVSSSDSKNGAIIVSSSPSQFQVIFFFFSLYLIAVAVGGLEPCLQAFGADQFDGQDPRERKTKSSFFNWWYLGFISGPTAALLFLTYIQDNLGWVLGFGIPCASMTIALVVFLMGTRTYRYTIICRENNPFFRIGKVFARTAKNWRASSSSMLVEMEVQGTLPDKNSQQFRFLYKSLLTPVGSKNKRDHACSISDVEDTKKILRLVPIWFSCLLYAIIFAQQYTLFTEQGSTLDRTIWTGLEIPAASLKFFMTFSAIIFVPIYDRVFVPLTRALTGKPSGITMLWRIGIGMFMSILCMITAALVEIKRLETASEYGLVDDPDETIPMSFWWLVPQYVLLGIADVFTLIGLQEFFYDQVPNDLRSAGVSLYLCILGVGSFLSSFLIFIIVETTGGENGGGWFSNNLNRAHLDYFYWLLGGLSAVGLVSFSFFSKSYVYN